MAVTKLLAVVVVLVETVTPVPKPGGAKKNRIIQIASAFLHLKYLTYELRRK